MRFLMSFKIPIEKGNVLLRDPQKLGETMGHILADINAEHAFFGPVDGQRGGYIIVDLEDASRIAAIAEPFLLWLDADLGWMPLMTPEDLAKAGPSIDASVKKYT